MIVSLLAFSHSPSLSFCYLPPLSLFASMYVFLFLFLSLSFCYSSSLSEGDALWCGGSARSVSRGLLSASRAHHRPRIPAPPGRSKAGIRTVTIECMDAVYSGPLPPIPHPSIHACILLYRRIAEPLISSPLFCFSFRLFQHVLFLLSFFSFYPSIHPPFLSFFFFSILGPCFCFCLFMQDHIAYQSLLSKSVDVLDGCGRLSRSRRCRRRWQPREPISDRECS